MTKPKCPLEYQEAQKFYQWCSYHPIVKHHIAHVANEQKCSIGYGHKLNSIGRKRGVSDYFLSYPSKDKHGLWIELKRQDKSISKPTIDQIEWLKNQAAAGYAAVVCYGADHAIEVVINYLEK